MAEAIPWDTAAINDDGPCGTLRDVVIRWKLMQSLDHEGLTGVTVTSPVFLQNWEGPTFDLLPQHLDQLADKLRERDMIVTISAGLSSSSK